MPPSSPKRTDDPWFCAKSNNDPIKYGFFKAANNLTLTARDPVSLQPELKACAVRVKRVMDFPQGDS